MSEEWATGQRVFVPRITENEEIHLKILKFEGDEDDEDPDVQLLYTEMDHKKRVVRQQVRFAKLSELEDLPRRAVKGGAVARVRRNLEAVECACGCGQHTSGATFKQGHDAKLKSRLLKTIRGQIDGDVDAAHAELEKRGWLKFLK